MKRQVVIVRRSEESGSRGRSRSSSVRYGECQKNHAANAGGYAVDGCREFMAGGDQGTGDALACAAFVLISGFCFACFSRKKKQFSSVL
ncbi:mini zinc finger protein 2-like [Senna tora]|uniref:Mini zinc finger protein 2-like n=1 Tax=Senna tora TaxID=362788 RepID=A0A834TEL6_9FABA|nr:mini zinc finger protein 2-like [Senna tora]